MSRTPPIKLDRKTLETMACYEPDVAGRLLNWGWRCHEGERICLEQEAARDPGARHALVIGADLLDPAMLADGLIAVSSFLKARQKADVVSRVRREAREARFAKEETNVVPMRVGERSPSRTGRSVSGGFASRAAAGRSPAQAIGIPSPALLAGINELQSQGMGAHEARVLAGELLQRYSDEEIASAVARMRGRQIANPARYIQRMLANDRSHAPAPMSTKGARPVRRHVMVAQGSGYQMLGWTSKDHPRSNGNTESRLKIWRTDTGKLAYKRPDIDETPPDFSEDPGLYETD